MDLTGNGESGFDTGEGALKTATTSKEGSRHANYPMALPRSEFHVYSSPGEGTHTNSGEMLNFICLLAVTWITEVILELIHAKNLDSLRDAFIISKPNGFGCLILMTLNKPGSLQLG